MEDQELTVQQRLALFREMIRCGGDICSWVYGADGHLIETNGQALVLNTLFERSGCLAYAVEHAHNSAAPLIMGGQLGLMWCAAVEPLENEQYRIHVLGPVLNSEISLKGIREISRELDVDLTWRSKFVELMDGLPVVNQIFLHLYSLQLHYCVTGERLTRSDIAYQESDRPLPLSGSREQAETAPRKDRHKVYMAEQELLRCVRDGDMNYRDAQANAGALSSGVRIQADKPMTQALVSTTTFVGLCVRAAIEGGLSPDTAYTVGDSYIQSMLECDTIIEVGNINHTMYEDFIRRVHRARTNPNLSRQVQSCCDYIELHLEEPLSIKELARMVGYTDYYFSRKFKQETGTAIGDYIRFARVERAKALLVNSDLPVSEIASRLQFCSSTHFSDSFRDVTGFLPQKYRKDHQRV